MNLKSLRYGIQYDARYGARLTEKYCRGASFFLWGTRAPKVYTRRTKHRAPKFQILRALLNQSIMPSNHFYFVSLF